MLAYHSNALRVDDLRPGAPPVAVVLRGGPEGAAVSLRVQRLDDSGEAAHVALRPMGAAPPDGAVLQSVRLIMEINY